MLLRQVWQELFRRPLWLGAGICYSLSILTLEFGLFPLAYALGTLLDQQLLLRMTLLCQEIHIQLILELPMYTLWHILSSAVHYTLMLQHHVSLVDLLLHNLLQPVVSKFSVIIKPLPRHIRFLITS